MLDVKINKHGPIIEKFVERHHNKPINLTNNKNRVNKAFSLAWVGYLKNENPTISGFFYLFNVK